MPALALIPVLPAFAVDEVPARIEAGVAEVKGDAAKMALKELDAAKRRVKALEDRKDEIEKQFHKARFDSLIDDVQNEGNDIRR